MPQSKAVKPAERGELSPNLLAKYNEMAATIPSSEDTTGLASILSQLADSGSAEALDAPWTSEGGKQYLNHPLQVTGLRRVPSDYPGGLPFFLVVTAVDESTASLVTFTTGAVAVVAQLVVAHARGWLPLSCKLVERERPTADGYYPQHLVILAKGQESF